MFYVFREHGYLGLTLHVSYKEQKTRLPVPSTTLTPALPNPAFRGCLSSLALNSLLSCLGECVRFPARNTDLVRYRRRPTGDTAAPGPNWRSAVCCREPRRLACLSFHRSEAILSARGSNSHPSPALVCVSEASVLALGLCFFARL